MVKSNSKPTLRLVKSEFRAWLEADHSKDYQKYKIDCGSAKCPIASYLIYINDLRGIDVRDNIFVGVNHITIYKDMNKTISEQSRRLPKWAKEFIYWYDDWRNNRARPRRGDRVAEARRLIKKV